MPAQITVPTTVPGQPNIFLLHSPSEAAALVGAAAGAGQQTLVFVHRNATALLVSHVLAAAGFRVSTLTGQAPASERKERIAEFASGTIDVLVATDALSIGWATHPQCTQVLHVELPPFTAEDAFAAVLLQREARVRRLGRDNVNAFSI